ncbi:MAG: hypothetical protein P8181_17605, partial [bacterium]
LWMYQRVFFGPIKHAANETLKDLNLREVVVFVPLIVMIVFMGVYPKPFLSRMEPAVDKFIAGMTETRMAMESPDATGARMAMEPRGTEEARMAMESARDPEEGDVAVFDRRSGSSGNDAAADEEGREIR